MMDIDTFFVRVPCVFFEKYEKHRIFMRCFSPATLLEAQVGGDKRDRTADLLNAIQALSQLSYTPTSIFSCKVVEISGIEPLTS